MKRGLRFAGWLGLFAASGFAAFAPAAQAAELGVYARTLSYSCYYYSKQDGHFIVHYKDETLPWGTRVFVDFGFGGYGFSWLDRPEHETEEAHAMAPYTWEVEFQRLLGSRSSMPERKSLQFVIRIELPDGTTRYAHGLDKKSGYFEAPVAQAHCVIPNPAPGFESVAVSEIKRD